MKRWSLSISTTAFVVLLTLGAYSWLESQNYGMAALALLFAFLMPLQAETMRDKLLLNEFAGGDYGTIVDEVARKPLRMHQRFR